ncbi:DUF2182 domain-containing protein [Rubrobacter tropicus]|uniref:DUF2182 domain-containing protein n=1 Tax=Rubrobacter tropicus TaxID=2653851 RepID=A0A6G8Q9R4_9ACTN|nr:DUF2182 domain-containing protein [Rubrobacter tropicus]QIN83162.1 DUF2182 domain-containing protein [Rubrobacter tropicus]
MTGLERSSAFSPPVFGRWRRSENLVPALVLLALAAAGWAYAIRQAGAAHGMDPAMDGLSSGGAWGPASFLFGWTAMMAAMMIPATLPLILLYRVFARNRLDKGRAGVAALLAGYVAVWAAAGLPVYAYSLFGGWAGPPAAALPALLLIVGGAYQFTPLKRGCHVRCSSPLFFLVRRWRPGPTGALRLGAIHGVDCVGCCAGLMAGLVALGTMNPAWMLTVAVVVFVEKTIPGGHRVAHPLGALMILGGVLLGASLIDGTSPGMEP